MGPLETLGAVLVVFPVALLVLALVALVQFRDGALKRPAFALVAVYAGALTALAQSWLRRDHEVMRLASSAAAVLMLVWIALLAWSGAGAAVVALSASALAAQLVGCAFWVLDASSQRVRLERLLWSAALCGLLLAAVALTADIVVV